MDNNAINKWLDDLARYFETRDRHGEDRAHWADVYNAENARKIKAALAASETEISELVKAARALLADLAVRANIGANHPNPSIRQYFSRDGLPVVNAGIGVLQNINKALAPFSEISNG